MCVLQPSPFDFSNSNQRNEIKLPYEGKKRAEEGGGGMRKGHRNKIKHHKKIKMRKEQIHT
jgi:hypothetical protein